jgi:hypothetical protein
MKSKFVLRVLAAMGILALSATVAQAGDGGKPSPLTAFFVCHSFSGASAGKVVEVEAQVFGNTDRQRVNVGKGTLACVWAKLFSPENGKQIDPNPVPTQLDQLKCYTVSGARKTTGFATYTATDSLIAQVLPYLTLEGNPGTDPTGVETGINPSEIRLICGPASYFRQ